MSFADRVKAVRRDQGITAAELAEKSGITLAVIQNIESGRRAVRLDEFFLIVDALQVVHPAVLEPRIDRSFSNVLADAMAYRRILNVIDETEGSGIDAPRQCPHGFHHPAGKHSCDGCWCEGERDRREYGWRHDTSPGTMENCELAPPTTRNTEGA